MTDDRVRYEDLDPDPLDVTQEHEHYWVDAYDDETGWHCTICGLTEYPGDPGIGEPYYLTRKPGLPRAVIGWVLVSLAVVGLSLLAAALLLGAQSPVETGGRDGSTQHPLGGRAGEGDGATTDARLAPPRVDASDERAWLDAAGPAGSHVQADGRRPAGVEVGTQPTEALTAGLPDTSTVVTGTATWCAPTPRYCRSWGGNAKLGAVQSFRYGDKPYRVRVCLRGTERCTRVTVVSFCACGTTLIDLSPSAFRQLAPLSRGRVHVTITRTLPFLPPTDTP